MASYVLVNDSEGQPAYLVETDDQAVGGFRSAATDKALDSMRAAGQAVAGVCSDMVSEIRAGLAGFEPTTIELQLGVKLSVEGGLPVVSRAGAEGTVSVKVAWTREHS
jgi:urea transporter